MGSHQLRSELGDVGDAILNRPPNQRINELVELGRADDSDREWAFKQRPLLRHLRRVVAALELVDSNDRDDDNPLRSSGGARSLDVSRGSGKELRCSCLVGRGASRRVDDRLGPGERLVETLGADHVDASGPRDRDHVVSPLLQDLDEVRSDPARGSGDGDPLARGFGLHRVLPFHRRGSARHA